jgi:hypothetical protein
LTEPFPPENRASPLEPADGNAPQSLPPSHPHFTARDVFIGPDGLRAGWGIAIFLICWEALLHGLYPLISGAVPATGRAGLIAPSSAFAYEGTGLLCVAVATWLMAKIEHRSVTAYGFARQQGLRYFCIGLGCGVALLSLLVAILRGTGLLVFDARLLFGRTTLRYGCIWLVGFLLVGLVEELLNRGYLQFTLARGLSAIYRWRFGAAHADALGFWTAALVLSFAFGFAHRANPGESPLGLLSAGLAGFLFCLSLWRTGSLWWAIGFHASWDWAQSFLYGVADSGLMVRGHLYATHPVGRPYLSGGLTGPEGSIFLLPIIATGVAAVLLTLPRTDCVSRPQAHADLS